MADDCFLIIKGSLSYNLTLILAARCIDGVVMVGDSKNNRCNGNTAAL
jgi:hypothetical protein